MNLKEAVNKFLSPEFLEQLMWDIILAFVIFIIANIVVRVLRSIATKFFRVRHLSPLKTNEKRDTTLLKLVHNIIGYVVYFITITTTLDIFGIPATSLIAGAGVLGLAIGFGAQNLVKDIVTGFFIIFENQFSVGDYVVINMVEGSVIEIGLRTTKVRGVTGELHIIPNGSILEVTNYSVYNSFAIVDIGISPEADIKKVEMIIRQELPIIMEQSESMIGLPEYLGVQNVTPTEVTIRVRAEATPSGHFAVGRLIRQEIKTVLEQNGIEMSYPRMFLRGS